MTLYWKALSAASHSRVVGDLEPGLRLRSIFEAVVVIVARVRSEQIR
jgi:hypothetical protein